jgi:hypothetical protein
MPLPQKQYKKIPEKAFRTKKYANRCYIYRFEDF